MMRLAAFPFPVPEDSTLDGRTRRTARPPADRPSRTRTRALRRSHERTSADVNGVRVPPNFLGVLELIEEGEILGALAIVDSLVDERSVAVALIDADEITNLDLDHREIYVLSLVDGETNVSTLLESSGMPIVAALHAFCVLVQQGAIEVVKRPT